MVKKYLPIIMFLHMALVYSLEEDLHNPFNVVWAAKTYECPETFGIPLDFEKYGIIANKNDHWKGDKISLLSRNDLGLYPYYDKNGTAVNGGIPQLTNLTEHFEKVVEDFWKYFPDPNYSGWIVIDWEPWRPIWERNWDAKKIYKTASISLVQERHKDWPDDLIEEVAKFEFETAARNLIQGTLNLCKKLRPYALLGLYEFPKCYKFSGQGTCSEAIQRENDELQWLYDSSTALFPSIYVSYKQSDVKDFVKAALTEAKRVTLKSEHSNKPIYPFGRFNYSHTYFYFTNVDLENTIGQSVTEGMAGIVLWGDYNDSNSAPTCLGLKHYLDTMLGPYILNVTKFARKCSEAYCSGHGRCIRKDDDGYHGDESQKIDELQLLKQRIWSQYTESEIYGNIIFKNKKETKVQYSFTETKYGMYGCQCYSGWHGNQCNKS
ncbi:hyaluronidase-1-like [Ptychodera flava]|uniref:hyaluronidase-1-like n=1 Tax=Ptychodera flava TaxID=63121 RepID=UPI00396A1A99